MICFLRSKRVKFLDLVKLKIVIIMYKARNRLLPYNLQRLFCMECINNYNLRHNSNFKMKHCRTNKKAMCLSITGVKLWNSLDERICRAKSIYLFKKLYKVSAFKTYRCQIVLK